jgi:DeoR/GlpR family transcriptional regulator of sugar metabolism
MKGEEKIQKILELIKDKWMSVKELRQHLKCSNNAIYSYMVILSNYPIAEEKRENMVYFKLMNKDDYT